MMFEREQRSVHPLAPASSYTRSDHEAPSSDIEHSKELKRKKRMKIFLYAVIFVVFQSAVIAIMAMTVMKFKSPKFRIRDATIETLDVQASSFNMRTNIDFGVKNPNFGEFKYQTSVVDFYYRDVKVGEAFVDRSKAKLKSTKKFTVAVDLTSANVTNNISQLTSDVSSGILPLMARSRLNGKVTIMFIMKKNKAGNMNCTMGVVIQSRQIQNLVCQ